MSKFASQSIDHTLNAGVWQGFAIFELLVLFAFISLLAAEPVPGVNETHYLPKAKHTLDATFAANDLFIQSHDSHLLSAGLAGCLTRFMPLTAAAWIGRALCWLFMAWSWRQLRISIGLPMVFGVFALAAWYFATKYGHWAGEWAIGGFEGKSLAYPCVLVAFAEVFRGNWSRVWLWLGTAVAWHPVAGGWAGMSFAIAWLCAPARVHRAVAEFKWIVLAVLIGLIGVWPAASGLNSPNQVGNLVASQVHVFMRLAHHLLPRTFGFERHLAALVSVALLAIATGFVVRKSRPENSTSAPDPAAKSLSWILSIAWISVGFSVAGLLIDLGFTKTRPILASQLLRFYWFRWSDIVVPLAWTLTFWVFIRTGLEGFATKKSTEIGDSCVRRKTFNWATICSIVAIVITLTLVVRHTQENFGRRNPAADDVLMAAPGNREIASDRYVDWLAVCEWIRVNSPPDSLWFTPEFQQTFKWYAQRAEVVCWKDVPQDNASVREWYQRVVACKAPRTLAGAPLEWKSEQLLELSRRYKFRWILVDRRIQVQPLLQFEILYPTETSNRSFAVFRIPEVFE